MSSYCFKCRKNTGSKKQKTKKKKKTATKKRKTEE